ncbi:MAG: DUF4435 domain-containing protein [Magnetococcales bacterium]|nr:DUF4435 domain-containing protein [Magnetococcales bacterium]
MGNFSTMYEPEAIGRQYSSRIMLYLESREDLEIFHERWFRGWSEWIEFQSVDAQEGGGGGSSQVFHRVQKDRDCNVPAFGIVDRDVLLNDQVMGRGSNWDAFLESNHAAFESAAHVGPYIKVLRRWEIENYLLHPVAVGKLMQDAEVKSNVTCSPNAAAQCLLDFSAVAILMTAANLVLIEHDRIPIKPLFEQNYSDIQSLTPLVIRYFETQGISDAQEKIDIKCKAIRSFLHDETGTPEDHWDQLNYLIDGKLFLVRFCKWFGFSDPRRLELARKICDHQLIDSEISEFMRMLKEKAIKLG